MSVLYAYWGVTTILLFWAAMIRATREWGGASQQGRAFGILDGGRGAVAAGIAYTMWGGYEGAVVGDVPSAFPSISLALPWAQLAPLMT